MDWSNVTSDELLDALREVDWAAPPRAPKEFFAKFTPPKTAAKWTSRLKCNVYFYRTNYFLILGLVLSGGFVRNPAALLAVGLLCAVLLLCNDTFATAVSERAAKVVRKLSPPLAAKMRNAGNSNLNSAPSSRRRTKVFICGVPRATVVLSLTAASAALAYLTGAITTVLGALFLAAAVILTHASMRTPNLKARLASAREEFRAVWRGYNDYTI